MASGRARLAMIPLIVAVAGGCSSQPAGPAEPPGPPSDWVAVASGADDLVLTLPPWLVPFETSGAVFANEVVAGGGRGIQLLAEGPRTVAPQPGREGTQRWLAHRIEAPGAGVAAVAGMRLPAGDAVALARIDHAGTPLAWRLVAYAITTPRGTAYLLVDGPPAAWAGREDDISRIPWLLRIAP